MNFDESCFYCTKDKGLDELMLKVCSLQASTVYLFKDQSYQGRCVVALKEHKKELFELHSEELTTFMSEVSRVAGAINKLFFPDKINYAIYGDQVSHLHFHIVPKYKNGLLWGKPFGNNPDGKKILDSEEYDELINLLRQNL